MEIWELASALGANTADEDDDPLADASGMTWNQRRATALAYGLPEPQFDDVPLSPKERADLVKLAQGAQVLMPPTVDGG